MKISKIPTTSLATISKRLTLLLFSEKIFIDPSTRIFKLERVLTMDKLISFSSILGGILLAATMLWVGIYNLRRSETRKGVLFLIFGLCLAIILIYSLLFNQ